MFAPARQAARFPTLLTTPRRLASTYSLFDVPEFPREPDLHQPTKPFLDEERRRLGLDPPTPETTEEGRQRYKDYLESLDKVPPTRPQQRVETNPNHGLWGFFRKIERAGQMQYEVLDRTADQVLSGRGWRASELRRKSFKDLHTLWYVVLRERNLIATQKAEATRIGAMSDRIDTGQKDYECRKTMARIKQVLNERRVAYEAAVNIQCEALSASEQPANPTVEKQTRGRSRVNAYAIARANAWRAIAEDQARNTSPSSVAAEAVTMSPSSAPSTPPSKAPSP